MSVLGIAAIMQPVLGKILDSHWDGTLQNGARIYNNAAYSSAFIWFLACTALSVIMVLLTRESFCRAQDS
jgi:hypothetical protein